MTTLDHAVKVYSLAGVHPAANLFPMMTDEERAGLAESATRNGWQEPVTVLPDGSLIDGRNRLVVSVEIGLDCPIRVLDVRDPIAWAVNANLHRRQLSTAQRAMVAPRIIEAYRAQAKARQEEAGARNLANFNTGTSWDESVPTSSDDAQSRKTATKVAATLGVGSTAVKQAVKLAETAPDLATQVEAGQLSLNAATIEAGKRPKVDDPIITPTPARTKPKPVMLTLKTHTGEEVQYQKPQSKSTFNPTNDHISWARWSWNPVTGCLHGCTYCYARDLATKASYASAYPVGFAPLFHHERLDAPSNTRVPADATTDPRRGRVFVCSMADLFGTWVPQEWIDRVYASMSAAPQWRYLTLTKFPQRYKRNGVPPHLWAGTSVDTQKRVRIAEESMREVPAAVRWLSVEPLEEPLTFNDLSWCDWVVIGSRTATNQPTGPVPAFAPPFEWVADLVAQARAAGAAVYLKPNLLGQVGPQSPGMALPQEMPAERAAR